MREYEIGWAELPPPAGRRPVLLLSRNDAYTYLHKVVVAEITTTIRAIPVEVILGSDEGLPKQCVANLDNIRTIALTMLSTRSGRLPRSRHVEVKRALGYSFGWEELIRIQVR